LKKALLALALVAVLASSATAAASTSPTAYKAQVNGMCAKGIAAINAIPKPTTAKGLVPYFQKAAKLSDQLLARIKAVKPPASLQAHVAAAIKLQAAFESALHSLISKLKTSSNPKQTVLDAEPKLDGINTRANKAWRAAGLVKCGS
jgi:hypothetical protein